MIISKREMPIRQEKELADLRAKAEDQQATIEYLSMMADIELPEAETVENTITGTDSLAEGEDA